MDRLAKTAGRKKSGLTQGEYIRNGFQGSERILFQSSV
jgi:hypothetical protein